MTSRPHLQPSRLNFNLEDSPEMMAADSPVSQLTQNMRMLTTRGNQLDRLRRKFTWSERNSPEEQQQSSSIIPSKSPCFEDSPMFQERVLRNLTNRTKSKHASKKFKWDLDDKENCPQEITPLSANKQKSSSGDGTFNFSQSEAVQDNLSYLEDDDTTGLPCSFHDLFDMPISTPHGTQRTSKFAPTPDSGYASIKERAKVKANITLEPRKAEVYKRETSQMMDISPRPRKQRCLARTVSTPDPLRKLELLDPTPRTYARSVSDALQKSSSDKSLIGDFSKSPCLPTIPGKHQDLQNISTETMARMLRGEIEAGDHFTIVDCRYPYEYEAGHIRGARNIFTREALETTFLSSRHQPHVQTQAHILVFHCEFSSERAPSLCRYLRKRDREINEKFYPLLHHPELYILDGGYKAFFGEHQDLCEPPHYKPMLHEDHSLDLKKYRTKSKSHISNGFARGLKF